MQHPLQAHSIMEMAEQASKGRLGGGGHWPAHFALLEAAEVASSFIFDKNPHCVLEVWSFGVTKRDSICAKTLVKGESSKHGL